MPGQSTKRIGLALLALIFLAVAIGLLLPRLYGTAATDIARARQELSRGLLNPELIVERPMLIWEPPSWSTRTQSVEGGRVPILGDDPEVRAFQCWDVKQGPPWIKCPNGLVDKR